jgi:alkylation response protein AidB-like acyl-CoA dehydrogenase
MTSTATTATKRWIGTARIAPSCFINRKVSIYGGSNEIQRNIITKAVLGL